MTRQLVAITEIQADLFIQAYRKTGLFAESARIAGTTKHQLQAYLKNKTAEAETLALNIEEAAAQFADIIEREMYRRAIDGVEEEVFHKGQVCGTKTVYSDTILMRLAEGNIEKYKKAQDVQAPAISVVINTFQPEATPTLIVDVTPTYISDLE